MFGKKKRVRIMRWPQFLKLMVIRKEQGSCVLYRHGVMVNGSSMERLRMLAQLVESLEAAGYDIQPLRREVRRLRMTHDRAFRFDREY